MQGACRNYRIRAGLRRARTAEIRALAGVDGATSTVTVCPVTQQYPPRQQQYPPQWGQPQGWPAQPPQAGWNAPPPAFGQPSWPTPPVGGVPQQGYRPGYQPAGMPGQFQPPPPRRRSPMGRVLMMLVGLCALLLVGVVVANMVNGNTPGVTPRPADNYTPPPPDMEPPDLPAPQTYSEATEWLRNSPLYQQSIVAPTDCVDLQPVDALNASEDALNAHLLALTGCLMKVWEAPVEAAGFVMPRPPATVYSQPIQTACGKLERVNASYCGADQRIYYAKPLPRIFPAELQRQKFLMELVLAHEFGHAIQARTGITISSNAWEQRASTKAEANVFSRRLEVQADCLAGMFVQAVGPSQGLTASELDGLRLVAYNLGDDILSGKPNIDSGHGLGVTRQRWFETGLTGSTSVGQCNTYTVPDPQVR